MFFLAFDIDNLVLSPEGTAKYAIGMEIFDAAGKLIYPAPRTPNRPTKK